MNRRSRRPLPYDGTAGASVASHAAMTTNGGQNLILEYFQHTLEIQGESERKKLFSES